MKKHVTIYIDSGVWESAKEIAWGERKSASRWVEDLIISNRVVEVPKKRPVIGEDDRTGPNVQVDDSEIELANARLLEKREKVAKLKKSGLKTGDEIMSYSKDRQLGKKGSRRVGD